MACLLAFTLAVEHAACGSRQPRHWRWNGKAREGRYTVTHACRNTGLWELAWAVATRSSCLVFVDGRSVDSGPSVCWRIEDGGDGDRAADGARKPQPPGPAFTPIRLPVPPRCDGARNGGVVANGEA